MNEELGQHSVNNIYEELGGEEFITKLIDIFYGKVMNDPILKPLFEYAHNNLGTTLEQGKKYQVWFLTQRFGGPRTYEQNRGHPRLKMRHNHFKIGVKEKDTWLKYMRESINEAGIPKDDLRYSKLLSYFEPTAIHIMNDRII
jgi:hemoglobin